MEPIEFELTRDDCRHAIEAHHRSRSGSWLVRVISLVFMLLGSLRILSGEYAWGTVFFAVGMTYPVLSARLASHAIVRQKPLALGAVRLSFRDDAIVVDGPTDSGTLTQLQRVVVAPRSLLLYVDDSHYLVVPRRVFGDAAQFEDVVDLARRLVESESRDADVH